MHMAQVGAYTRLPRSCLSGAWRLPGRQLLCHRGVSSRRCLGAAGALASSQLAAVDPLAASSGTSTGGSSSQQRPFTAAFARALKQGDLQQCVALARQAAAAGSGGGAWPPGTTSEPQQLAPQQLQAFIDACYSTGRPGLALELVQALPAESRHYNTLLRAAGRHRDAPLLAAVQAARAAAGLGPDSYSTVALVGALSSCRRLREALEAFRSAWAEAESCRTLEVCNAAIGVCAVQGNWGGAQEALAMLRAAGIPPDIVTYNSLLKAAGTAGAMADVLQLYEELQSQGLAPTAVTFTALFSAAARNRHPDIAWLLEVYEDMGRRGVAPNDYVMSSLFTAASYCTCSPADLEALFAALALYRARVRPNDTVFTALLMLCTRAGIADRAVDVWTAVQEDGVPVSAHLFSALFKACTAGSSPTLVDVAMQAYHDMQMWWHAHKRRPGIAKFERDMLVAYNALLHFIGEMAQLDEALAVFKSMQRSGPTPDVVTYNTVLAACSHLGDTNNALKIFSQMLDAGVSPTERTIGALLNAYAKARNVPSARMIFNSLKSAGLQPNVPIYTTLMDACVKDGSPASVDLAFKLLDRMRREGLQPSAVTYGCLLVACERRRDVDRAFQLYQDACDEGVLPTDECHNVLINVCTEAKRLDEALELVKRLARKHGTMQAATLNSLTRALCYKYVDRALRMLSLTQTLGHKPTRRTYIALISACARASKSDAAYQLYRALRGQGLEADGRSGSALITSLCQANELERAVEVYDDMLACAWRKELQLADIPADVAYRGGLSKRAQVPDATALAALTQAYAARGNTRLAFKYYKQLRRQKFDVLATRPMFELLIEGMLRRRNVKLALQVFDDWKGASTAWFATQGAAADSHASFPRLSNVTLAFLEACCRSEPRYEWRVYDVCAVMRQQKERKVQAKLDRPVKKSHHFFESSD